MDFLNRLKTTDGTLTAVVRELLPGESVPIARVRAAVEDLCGDDLASAALIVGPPGTGKTTLARAIALARYVHLVTPEKAREYLKTVTSDGPGQISQKSLPWFVGFPVTGLDENTAHAELFGVVPNFATGVAAKRGPFEEAARGRETRDDKIPDGARRTRGVVLLDEIGDLPTPLQAKLLTVVTGAEVSRLGGAGKAEFTFAFRGLTIAATWRNLRRLRRDLRARLLDHVIRLPELDERPQDLAMMARNVIEDQKTRYNQWLIAMNNEQKVTLPEELKHASLLTYALSDDEAAKLASFEWKVVGDLRGFVQVIRRAMRTGLPIAESYDRQRVLQASPGSAGGVLVRRVLSPDLSGMSLGKRIRRAELELRRECMDVLDANADGYARKLGVSVAELRADVREVRRSRERRRSNAPMRMGERPTEPGESDS